MCGLFISMEGIDGVGKSTQVERLRAFAESLGREVVVTREPGGTALGVAIRRMLLHGVDGAAADISPRAEALLFAADRAQHVAEVIRPALDRGAVVITDRYLDSSLAYQAGGRELTAEEIRSLSMWATCELLPARTYLLDMDPAASHARLRHDEDRMESAGDGFQARTRQAFLDLAAAEPNRFRVVDAGRSIDEVWAAIREDCGELLDPDLPGQTENGGVR
ncbi:dTMP kinase [Bifidobacterium eulemuris]|uniref:Thymidylate kinase n=1 Tax=Bifidobacterium eulemuris TaxID=1765219 RepID=A0A261G022_9BIFI|nr:dTMP kinase [Bifidobacterium eulemuris]OZG64747.1 thymidylate kinase [Bifidobacterium eulemuris]QOL32492.1 dTMP kinase [Bifidobacterium eulemuris]